MDACELSEFSSLPASGLQAHRKARRLISLQALDRVVQIGPPTQEIFCPPGQRERERQCPRCCSGGSDTLRRMAELEDRRVRIAARILNRTADQSRFRREPDGFRHTTSGASPKPFSRSAETGKSVASQITRACASASSRVTRPSRRPSRPADAPLEVASAGNPSAAIILAEPPSHTLAITNASGASCRERNCFALSARVTVIRRLLRQCRCRSCSKSHPDSNPRR